MKYQLERELQHKKLEMGPEREQQKIQLDLEILLEQMKLEREKMESREHDLSDSSTKHGFDATKHIRLVPRFGEKEVDKYFMHFEKVARSLKWPIEVWTLLLQGVLIDTIKRRSKYPQIELFNDEQIALWDCRERHKYYEFSADFDSDEFLLPNHIKKSAMKEILEDTFRRNPVGVVACYTYLHITNWGPTNATYPLFIGQYEDSTEPLFDRSKNIYMSSRMEIGEGTIHIVKPGQGFSRIHLDPSVAAIHHFRHCESFWFKQYPPQIFRNGTVTQGNVTCNTFSKVRPTAMKRQNIKMVKRMVKHVNSKLRI